MECDGMRGSSSAARAADACKVLQISTKSRSRQRRHNTAPNTLGSDDTSSRSGCAAPWPVNQQFKSTKFNLVRTGVLER
eukprot:SAG31_NODE_14544_length_800_cov_1.251070_2_plen_78_part_01